MDRATVRALIRVGRVHFVIAGFLLFVLGSLLAVCLGAGLSIGRFLWGYTIVGLAHLSVHYTNDYFDRHSDLPDCRSPVSGGSGVLPVCPELARSALILAILLSLGSFLLSVCFVAFFSLSAFFILFVLAGILLSWCYSAPPVRLCSRCLGEAATMLTMGIFLPGSGYFVMAGTLDLSFLVFSLPLLVFGLFFILSVELPDRECDLRSGKMNIAARFGLRTARWGIALAGLAAAALFLVFAIENVLSPCPLEQIFLASLVPVTAGFAGLLISGTDQRSVGREAARNVGSLIVFILLASGFILLGL